jgi:nucleotide-binding universal stress UspA family protein
MLLLGIRTVVVATDLDPASDAALDSASRLAAAAGAALHVVHVVVTPDEAVAEDPPSSHVADAVREALERAHVTQRVAKIHILSGSPPNTIRSVAQRVAADVVVIGPHRQRGRVGGGHPLGGTARAVAEHASASCLVAARPIRLPLERVLVSIDLTETARGTLLAALSWASALRVGSSLERHTTLTALHVDTGADGAGEGATTSVDRELERVRQVAGDWAGVDVRKLTEKSADTARAIMERAVAERADLVVLGTHERGLDEGPRLGSVAAAVSTALELPSLLVPPAVWRAHVSELERAREVAR